MLRALCLLLFALPCWGATYYIDCAAASNGSGTVDSPFNALASLTWASIETGDDDVLGRAGTTCIGALNVQASGTSNNLIELGVYDSAGNQITDGSARWTIDGNNANVKPCEITSRSWVRARGIDCKGSSTATDEGNVHIRQSDDITWHYSTITAGTGTNRNGLLINRGNRVDARYITANGFLQHGAFLYMPAAGTYTGISVRDSTFDGGALYGMRVACDVSNITAPSLTISGNTATGNGTGANGWGFRSNCPLPAATISNNNFSSNLQDGIELGTLSGLVADYDYSGGVVSGNTLQRNCQFGLHGISARNYRISGNSASFNGCDDATDFSTGIELVDNSGARETGAQAGTLGALTGAGVSFQTTSGPFDAADVGEVIMANNTTNPGAALVTAVADANNATVTILRDFTSTTVASGWLLVRAPYNVTIEGNTATGNYNYIADSSEGIGIRLDDNTLLSRVMGNFVSLNEGRGIAYNGPFNVIAANILIRNGAAFRGTPTGGHFEIGGGGVANSVFGNSIAVGGLGTTGERNGITDNSAANTSTDIRDNAVMGPGTAAIERVDTVSSVSFNGINGAFTRNVQDTSSNAETQTAGEVTADFLWTGGAWPYTPDDVRPKNGSPLIRAGQCYLAVGCAYPGYGDKAQSIPPTIGAQSGAAAAVDRTARP